jgi:predicted nucleic acid-binding protein
MTIEKVDTNVLVYSVAAAAPQRAASRSLMDRAKEPSAGLCIFPHLLAECFAIITNPKRVSPAKTPQEALEALEQFLALPGLTVLPLPADVVVRWIQLVRSRPVKGGKVFDRQTAAGMLAHGIGTIYTYNLADFQGIPGITAKEPPPR